MIAGNATLCPTLKVRDNHATASHLIRVVLVARCRSGPDDPVLQRALLLTLKGIATGLRNTG